MGILKGLLLTFLQSIEVKNDIKNCRIIKNKQALHAVCMSQKGVIGIVLSSFLFLFLGRAI